MQKVIMNRLIFNFIIIIVFGPNIIQAQYPEIITMEHTMVGEATIVARQSVKHLPGFIAKPGIKYRAYIDPNFIPPIPYQDPLPSAEINPSPSQDMNYIITKTAETAGSSIGSTTDAVMIDITYFDGLGRRVQGISSMASPDQKDLINYILYDPVGRISKEYIPYKSESQNQNGQFENYSIFQTNQQVFLESEFTSIDKEYGFTEYNYEVNPFNRVLKNSFPGEAWRLNSSTPHIHSMEYHVNSAPVNSWRFSNGSYQPIVYLAGELTIEVSKNENQDINQTITNIYKDKQGRTVMSEVVDGTISHRSLWIYDIFDNICCIIPPMAETPDQLLDIEYCYYYKYDDPKQRMTEKKIPGSGSQYFIYDKRDRLVMSQDANLLASEHGYKWYLTSYDDRNRKVMFGLYEHNVVWSRQQMQDRYNTLPEINEELNNNYNDIYHGYTKNVPIGLSNCCSNEILLVYYYDVYNFKQDLSFDESNTLVNISEKIDPPHTQSLITGTKVRVLNPESTIMRDWLLNAIYYNKKERPIQTVANNQLIDSRSVISSKYTFLGSIDQQNTLYYSNIANPAIYSFTEKYTYDHRNRQIKHILEGLGPTVLLSFNKYSATGNLATLLTHAKANGSTFYPFMQKTDFKYNIRGWLTNINNADIPVSPENDIFSMNLYYETSLFSGEPQFNGNISAAQWTTSHNLDHFGYQYSYDKKNQITSADFYMLSEGSWSNDNSYNENSISYDKNGNIKTLDRYGSGAQKIDQLSYTYLSGSNKLSYIRDITGDVPNVIDYPGNMLTTQSYFYDANGNIIRNIDKGITTDIVYNYLNLPGIINFGNNQILTNYYDANGIKRAKRIQDGSAIKSSSLIYCGRFIFNWDLDLMYILTPEGRIRPENDDYRYEYFFKDHLGNTRATYAEAAIGIPQVMEYQHYYPFGLQIEGLSYSAGVDLENNYLYNGKELQKDYDLQWYDYGARMYDPQIGRFAVVDCFAEKYASLTPYHYAANNPIYYIDINGDSLWITHNTGFLGLGGKQTLLYENGNLYNKDGSEYKGKVKGYLKQAKGALDMIGGVTSGKSLINQLESSKFSYTIQRGTNGYTANSICKASLALIAPAYASMAGAGGTISWRPGTTASGPNQLGNTSRPSFIGLSHEMGHASKAEQGLADFSSFDPTNPNLVLRMVTNDEFNAANIENKIRSEYGLPLRDFYAQDDSGAGFMRFLVPATSTGSVSGIDYSVSNPVQIQYIGPNSGR